MNTTTWLLSGTQALWFTALVLLAARRALPLRALLPSALGLLVSLVVSTTATPHATGVPLGISLGTGIAIALTSATRHYVTFTWSPGTKWWTTDDRPRTTEKVFLAATALYLCTAVTALATT